MNCAIRRTTTGNRERADPKQPGGCHACALRQKSVFRPFSPEELQFVAEMKRSHVSGEPGEDIIRLGETKTAIYTLYEGWAARMHLLPDGTRQILDIVLPGDTIGLAPTLLGASNHAVQALTPVSLCVLDPSRIKILFKKHPALALALLNDRVYEQERAEMRVTLLGRFDPIRRVAYLLLDLLERLRQRGMVRGGSACPFPLQRTQLADALGLSRVHLMRALRALRKQRLAMLSGRLLVIPDRRKLARFCGYPFIRSASSHSIL